MKKNTKTMFAVIAMVVLAFTMSFAGCHTHTYDNDAWVGVAEGHYHVYTCEHSDSHTAIKPHVDENGDGLCDVCGYGEKVEDQPIVATQVTMDATLSLEEGSTATLTATVLPANATDKTLTWTTSNDEVATVVNGVVTAIKEGTAVITATCGTVKAECQVTVTAKQVVEKEYEVVTTSVDFVQCATDTNSDGNTKLAASYTYAGKVTFAADMKFEPKKTSSQTYEGSKITGCVNTQGKVMTIVLSGVENSISIIAEGASSNGAYIAIYKGDATGEKLYESATVANAVSLGDCSLTGLQAGTYTLAGTGSLRVYAIVLGEKLEVSEANSLSVSSINTDYLVNREFSTNGLTVSLGYENGRVDALLSSEYTVDYSAVNMAVAGQYDVVVKYTKNQQLTATYKVNVFQVESLSLGMFTMASPLTNYVKQIYTTADTQLDTSNLTVFATGVCPGVEGKQVFTLNQDEYAVTSAVDFTTPNEYEVNVTSKDNQSATASYKINLLQKVEVTEAVTVTVDPSKQVSATNFKTITDAVNYLTANVDNAIEKRIEIANGTYNEKVCVNIPNLTIVGAELQEGTILSNAVDTGVVIIYDALAGKQAPNGVNYGTNGCATFTVGSKATNFKAYNITFKNYYNTNALYEESKSLTSDTQAVAVYVDGNKSAFYNCKFSSYHDTLYANNGWQFYDGCYIEGRTDYIFGQNAISYFNDCTIWSIGAGVEVANGGYVVALKPSQANTYYTVFNGCSFDGDENVKDGSIALGRAWGADMMMVVMNSTISGKFSTEPYTTGISQAVRYCMMSGNSPKAENMLEYNNTGLGAVSQSILDTCTVLTDADAYTVRNVFIVNGWDPVGMTTDVVIKLFDGENLVATIEKFSGSTLSNAELKEVVNGLTPPEGKTFSKVTNADGTDYNYETVLQAGEYTLAILWEDKVDGKTYTYIYNAENGAEWDTSMKGAGSSAGELENVPKYSYGSYLELSIASGNKVVITVEGFTTGTSEAKPWLDVILLDKDKNELKKVVGTTPTGKVNGIYTFNSENSVEILCDEQIASIRFACNASGKSLCFKEINVVVFEVVASCEHVYVVTETVAPTCTEAGYIKSVCEKCNKEKTEANGAATGHTWDAGATTTEATCGVAGVKTFTCSVCGDTKTEPITALSHVDENADGKCDLCGNDMPAGVLSATAYFQDHKVTSNTHPNFELKSSDETVLVSLVSADTDNDNYRYKTDTSAAGLIAGDTEKCYGWIASNSNSRFKLVAGDKDVLVKVYVAIVDSKSVAVEKNITIYKADGTTQIVQKKSGKETDETTGAIKVTEVTLIIKAGETLIYNGASNKTVIYAISATTDLSGQTEAWNYVE